MKPWHIIALIMLGVFVAWLLIEFNDRWGR